MHKSPAWKRRGEGLSVVVHQQHREHECRRKSGGVLKPRESCAVIEREGAAFDLPDRRGGRVDSPGAVLKLRVPR